MKVFLFVCYCSSDKLFWKSTTNEGKEPLGHLPALPRYMCELPSFTKGASQGPIRRINRGEIIRRAGMELTWANPLIGAVWKRRNFSLWIFFLGDEFMISSWRILFILSNWTKKKNLFFPFKFFPINKNLLS